MIVKYNMFMYICPKLTGLDEFKASSTPGHKHWYICLCGVSIKKRFCFGIGRNFRKSWRYLLYASVQIIFSANMLHEWTHCILETPPWMLFHTSGMWKCGVNMWKICIQNSCLRASHTWQNHFHIFVFPSFATFGSVLQVGFNISSFIYQ